MCAIIKINLIKPHVPTLKSPGYLPTLVLLELSDAKRAAPSADKLDAAVQAESVRPSKRPTYNCHESMPISRSGLAEPEHETRQGLHAVSPSRATHEPHLMSASQSAN